MNRALHLSLMILMPLVFVALAQVWADFILDDSYVTYRFSENLVFHHDLTWNLGEDPVEGFTSFSWMLVNALGLAIGLSAVVTSQAVSLASVVCMIVMLALHSRHLPALLSISLVAAIGLSPVMMLNATQGMETAFAGLLIFLSVWAAFRFLETQRTGAAACWLTLSFLSLTTRPDAALFQIPVVLVIVAQMALQKDWKAIRTILLVGTPLVIAGVAYVALRWNYFGYPLPNAFYIKGATDHFRFTGAGYVADFLVWQLGPYILLGLGLVIAAIRQTKGLVAKQLPVWIGIAVFLAYLMTIRPVQGHMYRFAVPVFPAAILSIAWLAQDLSARDLLPSPKGSVRIALIAFLAMLTVWPLKDWGSASRAILIRSHVDRVLAGEALRGLNGRMFVTEAGALPYFSQWTSIDSIGLTDEAIAHRGELTTDRIAEFSPDLIMGLYFTPVRLDRDAAMLSYMQTQGFQVVAANYKTNFPIDGNRSQSVHIYFANPASAIFDEITTRLNSYEGVAHMSADELTSLSDGSLPIAISANMGNPPQ
ncbi:MAG: hypothetical protein WBN04_14815 [Paracoccaceae bacterium]